MPAFVLAAGSQKLSRYDVVGEFAHSVPRFVKHVGLHDAENEIVLHDEDVKAVHMSPPLIQGEAMKAHTAGRVPLTNDEIKEISAWIREVSDEYEGQRAEWKEQYIIHPHMEDVCDSNTGVRRYRRYSCAGFVLDGYCEVRIELLRWDQASLPEIDREVIDAAYPIRMGRPLDGFGLEGDGPWRIVLPGYLLHALNRTSDEIRGSSYQASPGDELF